ncbi:ABC transporter permease [Erysipelothrix sp. HDW6C]|uniref:ABC transporter permease n=1 Tax=Erysipelothrix sp. HDW6C TaxID=2714930 RepID=UPI00140C2722|nr:ABC-2 family transporter protein [Erysipelothrix sp. HDW6C]QIK69582.1 ABC transporter permease [Erysipelothrix sp. HDW6C]
MSIYHSLLRTRILAGLQYRGAAIAGMMTQFVWGFLSIMLFNVLGQGIMDPEDVATYVWLRQAFLALTAVWAMDASIFPMIESGEVAYECLRPINLYFLWFVRNIAHRISRCLLRFAPVIIVALVLPEPFRLTLPATPLHGLMFIVSLLMTMLLVVSVNMLMYVFTFFSKNSLGIRVIFMGIFDLLDGGTIPLPFFPEVFQRILSYTFFIGLQTTPLFIYLGQMNPLHGLLLQIIWFLIITGCGYFLLNIALREVEVYGG